MANNVTGKVLGGANVTKDGVNTVQDLATAMGLGSNMSIKVNGQDADYSTSLQDFNFVSFGEKVKGGM